MRMINLVAGCGLLFAAACSEDTVDALPESDAGVPVEGSSRDVGGASSSDVGGMTDASQPEDLGPPDSGVPPDRVLVPHRIFGELPTSNLVMNPLFDLRSAIRPVQLDGSTPGRLVTAESPSGTPVLALTAPEGAFVFVQGRRAPVQASVWVGVPAGRPLDNAQVSIIGLGTSSLQVVASLERDLSSEVIRAGIVWWRFTGSVEDDLLGNALMFISPGTAPAYVAGPSAIQTAGDSIGRGRAPASSPSQPLPEATATALRKALSRWQAEEGRRLAPPKRTWRLDELPGVKR